MAALGISMITPGSLAAWPARPGPGHLEGFGCTWHQSGRQNRGANYTLTTERGEYLFQANVFFINVNFIAYDTQKGMCLLNGERIVFSTNGTRTSGYPHVKE